MHASIDDKSDIKMFEIQVPFVGHLIGVTHQPVARCPLDLLKTTKQYLLYFSPTINAVVMSDHVFDCLLYCASFGLILARTTLMHHAVYSKW
jgi:hypothetical protein